MVYLGAAIGAAGTITVCLQDNPIAIFGAVLILIGMLILHRADKELRTVTKIYPSRRRRESWT